MKLLISLFLLALSTTQVKAELEKVVDEDLASVLGETYIYLSRFYTLSGQHDPYTRRPTIWANALLGKGKHQKTKLPKDGYWHVTQMVPSDSGIVLSFYARGGFDDHSRPPMTFHSKEKRGFEHSIHISNSKIIVVTGSYGKDFPESHVDVILNKIVKK